MAHFNKANYEFRGKSKNQGKWLYGSLIIGDEEGTAFIQEPNCKPVEVDIETVGQFARALDRDGKHIFDGDVLKSEYGDYLQVFPEYAGWALGDPRMIAVYDLYDSALAEVNSREYRVVGNVFDNPNLLKGVKKNGSKRRTYK